MQKEEADQPSTNKRQRKAGLKEEVKTTRGQTMDVHASEEAKKLKKPTKKLTGKVGSAGRTDRNGGVAADVNVQLLHSGLLEGPMNGAGQRNEWCSPCHAVLRAACDAHHSGAGSKLK